MVVDSLEETLNATEANLLNYSIIRDQEKENPLKLKLKVSDKNKRISKSDQISYKAGKQNANTSEAAESTDKMCVSEDKILTPVRIYLEKIDLEGMENNENGESSLKRSKSVKAPKQKHVSEDIDELCSYMTKSNLKTPKKRTLSEFSDFTVESASVDTPKRRIAKSLHITSNKLEQSKSKRQIRAPTRYQQENSPKSCKKNQREFHRTRLSSYSQFYYDTEDVSPSKISEVQTPSKYQRNNVSQRSVKKNLNESFRRSALRSSISIDTKDGNGPVRRARSKSCTQYNDFIHTSPPKERMLKKSLTPRSCISSPKTPRNRMKLIREGLITPSMSNRSSIITCLPCREKEYMGIYKFLERKLSDGQGGCMYVSGVPGTGKTATVTSVITSLQGEKDLPGFDYINLNGMRLTEPKQAYVEIWKQLSGRTVPWEQAQSILEERFTRKKHLTPVIMLIDELDILCTKKQDVVYNLLDWPAKSKNQLIAVAIANTMDLPERLLMNRVTSRLGLTRLTFQPYTHKQLMEIIIKRLTDTQSFTSDAIQLVARKVASVSGDARRALDICRRAAEIAEEKNHELVTVAHINEALNVMIMQPKVSQMKRCSKLEKLILQAIVAEVERTGVEETTFANVFTMLASCCALDGFKMVSCTAAQRAVSKLGACRLILIDQKCNHIYQKIILNVSSHDVYFAIKN
ncbi:origin recognition complex subunit 1 isoform X2 [Cylas formicarius]|uniref:origin recognition complex subunit 1 isoform X2 n=1 Tax=Cylas formicarius TaxID=197179 RepID=UPI002958CDB8|nr:origin recognition complex subunit 1 isoform X2 [Cylas formicarius]